MDIDNANSKRLCPYVISYTDFKNAIIQSYKESDSMHIITYYISAKQAINMLSNHTRQQKRSTSERALGARFL